MSERYVPPIVHFDPDRMMLIVGQTWIMPHAWRIQNGDRPNDLSVSLDFDARRPTKAELRALPGDDPASKAFADWMADQAFPAAGGFDWTASHTAIAVAFARHYARRQVHASLDEALNSGDGTYKP